ncbi:MAG: chromosome segregation protein SMC [Candidatus Hydrogenedentes bacterium]|nr:chromosome segregation protein SMC [Candidatus Hydrogenedentota bacterium]
MYFKRIDLFGFKSFADKTHIDLQAGTTSIVGPNGCGKSNILDALRWCLGEQSAKALRGSHMQDIIFNGSEQRSPMGMAEVTLTFDNADNKLPLDFAEVQVTRRVYRSGESEYLINKAPCRLRDIQELFMDTGIGTNAYSLIGQGKIGMVLSSKPDDRRFLFEEAAGIIKYKARKKVALRKLDSAEQNLLRLSDIITEVQRQMRNLKRQVNAAIRHRELTEALRDLEVRNAWLHYNELSGQIDDLKERYGAAEKAYEKASSRTSKLEARQEELGLKRVGLERMLMARREGEYQVDSEMEKIESEIAIIRKEIEFSQTRHEQAQKEKEEFLKRAESVKDTQGETGAKSSELTAEIERAEAATKEKQAEYAEAEAAVAAAEQRVEAARARTLDTINTRNRTQTELETVAVSLKSVDDQLAGIFDRQKAQSTRHEDLTGQLNTARQQETEVQKQLTETVGSRKETQEKHRGISEQMKAANDEWQRLREEKSSKEARLNSLRELRDSYEGFATGVKAVMKARQHEMPEVDGIIGPVGDLLSTEKAYGKAIEAALGGNINNIICEDADAAKSAIAFLKQHRAGRVTFLPLDTIRSNNRDDSDTLRGAAGVIGKAINYVQCEARIMPAVEYLLYNTMIVETIDDAIRIARSERRYPRLVTLDGDVVTSSGAVTGGRTRNESQGMLGRSAEIEELEGAVQQAAGRINTLVQQAQQMTAALQELARNISGLEEKEDGLRQQLNKAGVEVARLATEVDTLTMSGSQLGEQRDKLLAQREELEARRAEAQGRIDAMEGDDDLIQRETAEAQDHAAKMRAALSTCSDALADLRVKVASLTQSLEEAERNRLREAREHQEALEEAARRDKVMADLAVKVRDLEAGIADHLERAQALSETKEQAHDKVLEAQKEQNALNEESSALARDLKELRAETSRAQKEVHTLELELTHREDRIAFHQERILTEYNLALASLEEKDVGTDEYDEQEREKLIKEHRKDLQRLGTVNLMAIEEYEALEKRDQFLCSQEEDLRKARETLLGVVDRIDTTIKELFMETFRTVSECFKNYFRRLFNGGQARVYLLDEDDPLESGIEIEARPPGKKPQTISLLSGGEQAMTAIALLFSIFTAKPSPFCVLDEVDAPLDDANVGRFLELVEEFVGQSQFIIITHNKLTMAKAGAIFGVTQQERGVSQLVSVKFEDVKDENAA